LSIRISRAFSNCSAFASRTENKGKNLQKKKKKKKVYFVVKVVGSFFFCSVTVNARCEYVGHEEGELGLREFGDLLLVVELPLCDLGAHDLLAEAARDLDAAGQRQIALVVYVHTIEKEAVYAEELAVHQQVHVVLAQLVNALRDFRN
jgi:hypothetical protein